MNDSLNDRQQQSDNKQAEIDKLQQDMFSHGQQYIANIRERIINARKENESAPTSKPA